MAIKKRENLRKRMRSQKTQLDRDLYKQARKEAEYTIRHAKRKGWEEFCSNINAKACNIGRVIYFIVFIINQSMGYKIEILTKQEDHDGPISFT